MATAPKPIFRRVETYLSGAGKVLEKYHELETTDGDGYI